MEEGKRYTAAASLVDRSVSYEPDEAINLVQQTAKAKFDESVELHIRLGVDSRHADQQVRGAVVLPHGTGRTKRVLVFAKVRKPTKRLPLALILSVPKSWLPRLPRKTGLIMMSSLPPRT